MSAFPILILLLSIASIVAVPIQPHLECDSSEGTCSIKIPKRFCQFLKLFDETSLSNPTDYFKLKCKCNRKTRPWCDDSDQDEPDWDSNAYCVDNKEIGDSKKIAECCQEFKSCTRSDTEYLETPSDSQMTKIYNSPATLETITMTIDPKFSVFHSIQSTEYISSSELGHGDSSRFETPHLTETPHWDFSTQPPVVTVFISDGSTFTYMTTTDTQSTGYENHVITPTETTTIVTPTKTEQGHFGGYPVNSGVNKDAPQSTNDENLSGSEIDRQTDGADKQNNESKDSTIVNPFSIKDEEAAKHDVTKLINQNKCLKEKICELENLLAYTRIRLGVCRANLKMEQNQNKMFDPSIPGDCKHCNDSEPPASVEDCWAVIIEDLLRYHAKEMCSFKSKIYNQDVTPDTVKEILDTLARKHDDLKKRLDDIQNGDTGHDGGRAKRSVDPEDEWDVKEEDERDWEYENYDGDSEMNPHRREEHHEVPSESAPKNANSNFQHILIPEEIGENGQKLQLKKEDEAEQDVIAPPSEPNVVVLPPTGTPSTKSSPLIESVKGQSRDTTFDDGEFYKYKEPGRGGYGVTKNEKQTVNELLKPVTEKIYQENKPISEQIRELNVQINRYKVPSDKLTELAEKRPNASPEIARVYKTKTVD